MDKVIRVLTHEQAMQLVQSEEWLKKCEIALEKMIRNMEDYYARYEEPYNRANCGSMSYSRTNPTVFYESTLFVQFTPANAVVRKDDDDLSAKFAWVPSVTPQPQSPVEAEEEKARTLKEENRETHRELRRLLGF